MPIRVVGLLLIAASVLYLPWMLSSLNGRAAWLAYPFAIANSFSILYVLVVVWNQ